MARLITCGYELGARGESAEDDLFFWDSDETYRTAGNMWAQTEIVRVNGRALKVASAAGYSIVGNYFTGVSELWFRMAYRQHITTLRDHTNSIARFVNSNFSLRINGETQFLSLWNEDVKIAEETVRTIHDSEWVLIELHWKNGSSGRAELRADGVTVLEFDGNLGSDSCTGVTVGCHYEDSLMGGGYYYFDDVALNSASGTVNNSWCGDGHIVALRPNGNGVYSEMTGSDGNQVDNYALVDENPVVTDDYVEGVTVGLRDSYQLQSSVSAGIPPNATIKHVEAVCVGMTLNVGGDAVEGSVRTGGANFYGTKQNLHAEWQGHRFPFEVNPDTGDAWTTAELDAAETGVRTANA